MTIETGGSAFPSEGGHKFVSGNEIRKTLPSSGMTLRDYLAAKALPAVYRDLWDDVRAGRNGSVPEDWRMGVAIDAYAMADAMIEARTK